MRYVCVFISSFLLLLPAMARLKGYLFLLICLHLVYDTLSSLGHHAESDIKIEMDKHHYNVRPPLPKEVEGTAYTVPIKSETPDFRVLQAPMVAFSVTNKEVHRPYRISPHYQQVIRHTSADWEHLGLLGCYCCTVYKERIPLAGCAIITTRHLLTTATSTELVLGARKHYKHLEGILGAWYDAKLIDKFNSSMYMTPARIHYHPKYIRPHEVNVSHPLPFVMDIAVWAATIKFHYEAVICNRGITRSNYLHSPTPPADYELMIVGFQWIKAWNRKPTPFHKYFFRTRTNYFQPCPKQDWGWFHCVRGPWFKLGVESGAALHSNMNLKEQHPDGLIGLNAFSMKLRTKQLVHYFTNVDSHPVLEFLYDAYMGKLPYEYLDARFHDTKNRAPLIKRWYNIPHTYPEPVEKIKYVAAEAPFW